MSDSKHIVCPSCSAINRLPADKLAQGPKCGKCGASIFTGKPAELTDQNFERHVSRSDIPVVVDFWAGWCGPCKMMAPAYEQAAARLEPEYILAKLNTEEAPGLSARYGIQSIPTLVVFRQGRELARQPGAMGLPQIVQWVRSQA